MEARSRGMIGEAAESREGLRILAVTNMFPTREEPSFGIYVNEQVESLRCLGLSVEVLFVDRRREGRRAYWRLASRLEERLAAFDPDVVHAMYGGVMAERVTRHVSDRPVVVTYHGSDLQGVKGLGAAARLTSGYGVWSSFRAARRASGIVAVAAHLEKRLPPDVDRRRVRVIACGIDLERFKPGDREACRLRLDWPDSTFHVLFATNNDDPIKRPELAAAAVEALAATGATAELHVLKGIPYPDVPVWLNASDVVLLTSLSEGSPTVVKEALACNRPVVSVAVGDVAEQIAGIEGCYLSDPTPKALAERLNLVQQGPRLVEGRGCMARHSLETTAGLLRKFYEETLDRWNKEGFSRLRRRASRGSPETWPSSAAISRSGPGISASSGIP